VVAKFQITAPAPFDFLLAYSTLDRGPHSSKSAIFVDSDGEMVTLKGTGFKYDDD
jgi:hypothetical protein